MVFVFGPNHVALISGGFIYRLTTWTHYCRQSRALSRLDKDCGTSCGLNNCFVACLSNPHFPKGVVVKVEDAVDGGVEVDEY